MYYPGFSCPKLALQSWFCFPLQINQEPLFCLSFSFCTRGVTPCGLLCLWGVITGNKEGAALFSLHLLQLRPSLFLGGEHCPRRRGSPVCHTPFVRHALGLQHPHKCSSQDFFTHTQARKASRKFTVPANVLWFLRRWKMKVPHPEATKGILSPNPKLRVTQMSVIRQQKSSQPIHETIEEMWQMYMRKRRVQQCLLVWPLAKTQDKNDYPPEMPGRVQGKFEESHSPQIAVRDLRIGELYWVWQTPHCFVPK